MPSHDTYLSHSALVPSYPALSRRNNRRTADDEPLFSASDRSKTIVPTVGDSNYSTLEFPAQTQVLKLGDVPENNRCPPEPAPKLYAPCEPPTSPSSLRANPQPTNKMSANTKNTMTTSAAQPTSPLATAGTGSATASSSAPLLLRAAAHPGHDRARNQRPSSPVAYSLAAPPAHLSAFDPFWDTFSADAKRKMLGVTFHELEKSVEAAKAEGASTAIQLADDEHLQKHNALVEDDAKITAAFDENNATLDSLERHVQECRIRGEALGIKEHSAVEAVHASARAHTKYKAGLLTAPPSRPQRSYSTSNMPPPPPRAAANAVHHPRLARAPPVERPDPSATWAAVASRRQPLDAQPATDDSCLDVRVSSLRHHNWDFPLAPRDAIFVFSTTTHNALEDVGRSKASLSFPLDLALKTPSPLSADIVSDTIELCAQVRAMFDARYSPLWFSNNVKKARESRPNNRRVEFDSSASDRSVEARRPRHRDEPTSGRGKRKRAMTALTTDSDSGPDSDRDNRPSRQVIPLVFTPPTPSVPHRHSPPVSLGPGEHTVMTRCIVALRHGRLSERP